MSHNPYNDSSVPYSTTITAAIIIGGLFIGYRSSPRVALQWQEIVSIFIPMSKYEKIFDTIIQVIFITRITNRTRQPPEITSDQVFN